MIPSATDILTRDEVAGWLKVAPRQVERLGVPCLHLGRKTLRYLRSDVLAWLDAQRMPCLPLRRRSDGDRLLISVSARAFNQSVA